MKSMRQTTLQTLGLGSILDIFQNGRLPAETGELVDRVFGTADNRGSIIISGGNGIVGSGKAMQLGSRLLPFDVPIVTLDLPDAPDGIGLQYSGLKQTFGPRQAGEIMANIICLKYDGASLPNSLSRFKPRFLLEAIPEILPLKKSHYDMMRRSFPDIEIRSVTSGFPSSELGVGILHPSFPHQINKIWEVVEDAPSDITRLLLALGLIPIPVSDNWSFVLDVLFCGITLAATRYSQVSNMPYWKIDKYIRRLMGPNPLRAHDVIGPGASFLTWSCLHHLAEKYGEVFRPTPELVRRKNSGETWYSSNRPTVDWDMDDEEKFNNCILGAMFQMTSLLLHENRAHLTYMNAIGELCAQFNRGILAYMRRLGSDAVIGAVQAYHRLHPLAAKGAWYPQVFEKMDSPEWKQLYVNAEHNGAAGLITISRESLNWDVIDELNRALDWLKAEKIKRVILTGDFHLSTQMVGADTNEFFPALNAEEEGFRVASAWAKTARRFNDEFEVSVGFINGKRCLGGMMELMIHCHYLLAEKSAQLGMPEVTLPVVPGMEGCHWLFRKAAPADYPRLLELLLTGKFVPAKDAVGWLIDFAGSMEDALRKAWSIVTGGEHGLPLRKLEKGALTIPRDIPGLPPATDHLLETARKAIMDCIQASGAAPIAEALEIQAKHSAGFMLTKQCRKGAIGKSYAKMMEV